MTDAEEEELPILAVEWGLIEYNHESYGGTEEKKKDYSFGIIVVGFTLDKRYLSGGEASVHQEGSL